MSETCDYCLSAGHLGCECSCPAIEADEWWLSEEHYDALDAIDELKIGNWARGVSAAGFAREQESRHNWTVASKDNEISGLLFECDRYGLAIKRLRLIWHEMNDGRYQRDGNGTDEELENLARLERILDGLP